MDLRDLNGELITGSFYEKELQKKKSKRIYLKVLKRKGDKLYVKWKGYENLFNSWIDKKDLVFRSFGENINVKVDLSNYATKTDLKNITHIDTSSFALKTSLASLKTEVDKLDIDKLAQVPVDLSKLSDVVKMMLLKRLCMVNWLQKEIILILVTLC